MTTVCGLNENLSDVEILVAIQVLEVMVAFQNVEGTKIGWSSNSNHSVFAMVYNIGTPTRHPQVLVILLLGPQTVEAILLSRVGISSSFLQS